MYNVFFYYYYFDITINVYYTNYSVYEKKKNYTIVKINGIRIIYYIIIK